MLCQASCQALGLLPQGLQAFTPRELEAWTADLPARFPRVSRLRLACFLRAAMPKSWQLSCQPLQGKLLLVVGGAGSIAQAPMHLLCSK